MGRGSWQTRTLVALVAVLAASLCVIVSRPLTTLPWASVGVLAEPSSVSPACGAVRAVVPSSSNDTVHVAHAICGGYGRDGKGAHFYAFTVIKSALMARARSAAPDRRMHFHVVVDGSMANILRDRAALLVSHPGIADVLDYVANHTGGRVSLTLYADSDVEHAVTASVGATDAGAITLGLFRHCSTARLKLPFAPQLANASRLLYVDYDSVVLCDLALLWDTFDWGGGGALMAATTEMAHVGQPSMYRGMPAAFGAAGGLNAGVLFMHLDRMRAVGLPRIWAEMAAITRARGYEAPEFANVSKGPQHTTDGLPFGERVGGWVGCGGGCGVCCGRLSSPQRQNYR